MFHRESPAPEIVQQPRVRGEIEGEPIGAERLPCLAVPAVLLADAVLAVTQKRAAQIGKAGADLDRKSVV